MHSILQTHAQTQTSTTKTSSRTNETAFQESNTIVIDLADAPAAANAFKLMRLDTLPLLQAGEMMDLIQTLTVGPVIIKFR